MDKFFALLLSPLKWILSKIFDTKTPISRVIIAIFFILSLIMSGFFYIYLTDKEKIEIIKAENDK